MLLPQPVRLSPASALMRTLNMVRELFTRLAGLSAPRRRRLPFVCGQMRALAAMWSTTGRSLHRYGGSTRSRRESG
jgi:hypothetical protein